MAVLDRLHQFDDAVASLLRAMKWRWAGVSENCKSGARGWAVSAHTNIQYYYLVLVSGPAAAIPVRLLLDAVH